MFIRIVAIVKYLAFHGKKERLFEKETRYFFSFVEMLTAFDPIMSEHDEQITSGNIHHYYLSHFI